MAVLVGHHKRTQKHGKMDQNSVRYCCDDALHERNKQKTSVRQKASLRITRKRGMDIIALVIHRTSALAGAPLLSRVGEAPCCAC
eukprot:2976362-Amphidinium_carterae.1